MFSAPPPHIQKEVRYIRKSKRFVLGAGPFSPTENQLLPFLRARIRWILIFWMFVVSAIAYLDRVNISIAGPTIAKEFHLDNVQLGWIFSAFVLGYALFQAPGGRITDGGSAKGGHP